jgi:LuxR family maltose regulon positive regulatory protein
VDATESTEAELSIRREPPLRSSLKLPQATKRNGMTALPNPALDRVAPMRRPPLDTPVHSNATVVPLIQPAAGPIGLLDGRAAAEPTVLRRALCERLDGAGAVTVVSAPAASGKTCLLRSWIVEAGLGEHAGWTTVKPDERDERRFWLSVIAGLSSITGIEELARLSGASILGAELLVERLLSDLEALEEPGLLVIDDLHELKSVEAQAQLERLLTRLPAQLRVVLLTRASTQLGLHRLRLTGALTELRAPDLRFSLQETRELLENAGIALSDAGVALLHERTEGWAGALRLAATAVAAHPDPERFVNEFSGSERTVAGYLRAEVLDRQPPEVRDMLLRTSVVERVNGPLADALAGGSGSERVLHELDDCGAFVTALDVGRSWFRYHPMFADLLRLELRRVNPTLVCTLHRVAGQWHEQHGDIPEAIRHAQAAGDWTHAAQLLGDHQLALMLDGRAATVRDLLGAFPSDAATRDAELALAFATAQAFDGFDDEGAADRAVAERLGSTVPEDRRDRFELGLARTGLWLARLRGDVDSAVEAFRSVEAALRAQPPGERARTSLEEATALLNLGIAELWSLQLENSRQHLEQALALARRIARPYLEMMCLAHLALGAAHGGLSVSVARRSAEQAAAIAKAHDWETHRAAAPAFAAEGLTRVWLGRFADGAAWLDRARHALAHVRAPAIEVLLDNARGLHFLGQRRFEDALAAFRAAEVAGRGLPAAHPIVLDLRGRILRTQLQTGEAGAVRAALIDMPEHERSRSEMRLVAAALDLSEGLPDQALDELGPVVDGSAPAVYPGLAAIEARLLDAAAHDQLGDVRAVEVSLERALALAEPDGILLPFAIVAERRLLERHRGHRTAHATLVSTILDMLAGATPQPETEPLCEPLSDAELRVVRHLPSNLKATEIAAELCVSANTVRTHLRHIYGKLDVHNRTEAVTRARRLGLLAPAGLST